MKITIGLVDNHQLFLKSLSLLIESFEDTQVILTGLNGQDILQKLEMMSELPDILVIDVDMPVMNGVETAKRISQKYPVIKLVALSVKDDDLTIINMLKSGCCSYLVKDIHPNELEKALHQIFQKGYYNADAVNINYRRLLNQNSDKSSQLTEKELKFLQLACSDLTYKQIALQMNLSERTIDGYRENIFKKLKVQSRVGMALEAIRQNLVHLELN